MGIDPRVDGHITRSPHRRQVAPFAVAGRTQVGEWINRLYERVQNLEAGTGIGDGSGEVDPNAPAPVKYTTGNLPLADAQRIGDWTAGAALPSLGDLQFQKDYNHWIYGAMANDSLRIDNIEGREKDYATRTWTQSWVANYYAPIDHKHPELAVDLTGYATEAWVTEQLAGINLPEGGGDVDLTGYATEAWVEKQGYIKGTELDHEMEPFATKDWVNEGFISNDELADELSPYAEKDWVEDTFVTYEVLEETAYSAARVGDGERAVWAGQKQVAPVADPGGSIGWAYKSAGDGTKAHWTLWSQDRDASKKLTLADVYSYSLVMTGKGQMPYLQVYTKRKNDGQDAASTYRSRISYELDGQIPSGLVTLALATSAPETPLYANLNRLILNRTQPRNVSEAEVEAQPRFSTGPGEADEEISKVCLTTNSAAAEGDFDFMVASLVLHTKHGTYDTQLEITGSGEEYDDTELVARVVALENDYTTTDDFNNLLKRTQDNAKAIEVNTESISGLQSAFDTAVLAAQDGAENLEIELQSYAKAEDTYTKGEVDALIPEIPEGLGEAPTLEDVLEAGNIAKPGQSIRFSTSPTPITLPKNLASMAEDLGAIQPGFGSYQGALLKITYITPEVPIEGEGDSVWLGDEFVNGVYKFETATDTQVWTENPDTRGGNPTYSGGMHGISWEPAKGTDSDQQGRSFWINPYSLHLESQKHNLLLSSGWDEWATFTIDGQNAKINTETGTIEAKEFIGDGSKLTNLPSSGSVDVDWDSLPELK